MRLSSLLLWALWLVCEPGVCHCQWEARVRNSNVIVLTLEPATVPSMTMWLAGRVFLSCRDINTC